MRDWLLTGPLMDEAGDAGGGGGTAVADVSSDYGGGEPSVEPASDGEVHDAEFVDPEAPAEVIAPPQQTQALVKAGERTVVNGKVTGTGRAILEAIRPVGGQKMVQEVTQALLTRDYFLQQFPGGKKEVAQLRALAEQHGGEEGIGELQKNNAHLATITEWFDNASPQFVDMLTENEERQIALAKLMPAFLRKFDQIAPDVLGHYQAQGIKQMMEQEGLTTLFVTESAMLNRAGDAYKRGDHQLASSFLAEIIQYYNAIHEVFDKIYTKAKTPPVMPGSAKDPALDDRAKQLTAREQALQKQEWETVVAGNRRATFAKAWGEVTKGRTITPDQDTTIKGFYELRMTAKLKQWQNQSARFFANGDKDGYLREQFAFFQKAIPDALRQAMQQALPGKPGPKVTPAPGPIKPPLNGKPTNGTQATRVAKMPDSSEFDYRKTTDSMVSRNMGYLKDGRLIQWA